MDRGKYKPYDSSKTRVCPAFIAVRRDPKPFLGLLSKLGIDTEGVELKAVNIVFSIPDKQKEKALNPNPEYLRWLLQHPEKTEIEHNLRRKRNLQKSDKMRLKLICPACRTAMIEEGLKGIDDCKKKDHYGRYWFVLEGATKPDVFIETNKFCLIAEGKRTEGGPKKDTRWKRHRHQIVRHLEGLRNYVIRKKPSVPAYGIFIVRGRDKAKFEKIYDSIDPFIESLPHAKSEEVCEIKRMYKGCLSWGDIYEAYDRKIAYVDHIQSNGERVLYHDYNGELDDL